VDGGLQSIDAVLLCGEVEDAFQMELDPALIFDHKDVGSFAAAVPGSHCSPTPWPLFWMGKGMLEPSWPMCLRIEC
jgi:hypothetical protein